MSNVAQVLYTTAPQQRTQDKYLALRRPQALHQHGHEAQIMHRRQTKVERVVDLEVVPWDIPKKA